MYMGKGINMKRNIFLLMPILFLCVFMQNLFSQDISPEKIVDLKVKTSLTRLKKDGIIDVFLVLNIKQGWHVNSDKPFDSNLSPTSVNFQDNHEFKVVKITYPPPMLKKLSFSESELALFENETTIKAELKPTNKEFKGKLRIDGELNYQPCNNETCLFPVSKPFSSIVK